MNWQRVHAWPALAISMLPIAQYPSIAPPAVSIHVTYPGASASQREASVTGFLLGPIVP